MIDLFSGDNSYKCLRIISNSQIENVVKFQGETARKGPPIWIRKLKKAFKFKGEKGIFILLLHFKTGGV